MVRAAVVVGLLVVGCRPYYELPDSGPPDASADVSLDSEAGSAIWLQTCQQFYAQPGLGSTACTSCQNQTCNAEGNHRADDMLGRLGHPVPTHVR